MANADGEEEVTELAKGAKCVRGEGAGAPQGSGVGERGGLLTPLGRVDIKDVVREMSGVRGTGGLTTQTGVNLLY